MSLQILNSGLIDGLHKVNTKGLVLSGSSIDLSSGDYFSKTITSNTEFTVNNVPINKAVIFTLAITGGSNYTVTWWNVKWPNNKPPTLSNTTDVFKFYTNDGGVTWYGVKKNTNIKDKLDSHWIATLGGSNYDFGFDMAVDSSGNVYITGETNSQGAGSSDILIAKYDTSGTLLWQRTLGGSSDDFGFNIAVDSSGNVYITGETNSQGAGQSDVLIAKYNTSGTLLWQRTLGGSNGDYGYGIAVDSSGNVYITGEINSQGAGSFDILIAKYNTSGTLQWQRTLGGASSESGNGIAVDLSGNVYIIASTLSQGAGQSDVLIAKYNTNGTLLWQRTLGGSDFDSGFNISVDSSGNVYIIGSTLSQGAGSNDILIAKYNTNGTLLWQRTLGGSNNEYGAGIAVDSSGNVYITGRTDSQGAGSNDVLVAKYNTNGTLQWQRTLGGGDFESGRGIAVDSSGNVYITGRTDSQGAGSNDVLVAKLPSDGSGLGTYFSDNIIYLESNLTDQASTLTDQASTLTDEAATLTDQASSLTDQTSTLLSTTVVI